MAHKGSAKKKYQKENEVLVFAKANINNLHITVARTNGEAIATFTAGKLGFKNSKKCTPHSMKETIEAAAVFIKSHLFPNTINIVFRGMGPGLDIIKYIPGLFEEGKVASIAYDQNVPHNGTRKRRKRRV